MEFIFKGKQLNEISKNKFPSKITRYTVVVFVEFFFQQNQFFISSLVDQGVKNTVIDHVRSKIADAHKNKKTFRVIICIPLLPEFEGTNTVAHVCLSCTIAKCRI